MPTRIYDATLLDFQVAPCADVNPLTGAPMQWNKSQVAGVLSTIIDARTLTIVPERFTATALRWRTATALGLPFSPFKVYKRKKSIIYPEAIVATVPGNSSYAFLNGPYWQISLSLKNSGLLPDTFTIVPLDQNQEPIPDAQSKYSLPVGGTLSVRFAFPNMFGIAISSKSESITALTGIRMDDFLNDKDWQLLETVGLPFKAAPNPAAYQDAPNGYPLSPVTAYQAAINRVKIAQLFYQQPVFAQPDGVTLPDWPLPAPTALIDSYQLTSDTLDGYKTGILYDIEELLRKVQTSPFLYDGSQSKYLKTYRVKSFSDDGGTASGDAEIRNPVCGTTLLGVATDCWNALGLGFGTTDFANALNTSILGASALEYDYMVTASFQIPQYNKFLQDFISLKKYDHMETFEVAALAHPALPLPQVSGLKSEIFTENRPQKVDLNFSDEVKLFWDKPGNNVPTGYAVALKDTFTGQLAFLNAPRPFIKDVKRPHLPAARADAKAEDLPGSDAVSLHRFFHHRSERSETGPATKNYYVAAIDVFGRWSAFQKTVSTLPAAPLVTADIISGQFRLNIPDPATLIHKYDATLELIVAWHWDDRTPKEINIGGRFIGIPPAGTPIDTAAIIPVQGIPLNTGNIPDLSFSIAFNGSTPFVKKIKGAPPYFDALFKEADVIIDKTNSAPPHAVAYKIRIRNFSLDFSNVGKLAFAAYVRSSQTVSPALVSPFGKPKMIYALDPLPRVAPVLPPDIQWASLPDANNISRFRVTFGAVPQVAGYAIYRATEASLRHKAGLPDITTDLAAGTSLAARRDDLLNLSPAIRLFAKDAFIRINTDLLKMPAADVELPGDLDGLYVYAITSFTDQRVESAFSSGWLYVGVPRRYTPPAPALSAFTRKIGDKREVTLKVEVKPGIRTERLDIFKSNRSYLAASLDLMGPPVLSNPVSPVPAGWKAFSADDVEIIGGIPAGPAAYYKITNIVDPGWQPVHYRAAGFGTSQPVAGKLPGRSKSSNMVAIQVAPPDTPPVLINPTLKRISPGLMLMQFSTNADIHPTSFGSFRLTVQKRNIPNNIYDDVLTKEFPLIPARDPIMDPGADTLWRLSKDAVGNFQYEYYVNAEDALWYNIVVTDPLGRSSIAKVFYQKPELILRNLSVNTTATAVTVLFEINRDNALPPYGNYLLEIITQKKVAGKALPVPTLDYSANLDTISTNVPPALTNPAVYIAGSSHGIYQYSATFNQSLYLTRFKDATVLIRVTDPDGKVTNLTNASGRIS